MDADLRGFLLSLAYNLCIFFACYISWLYVRAARKDPSVAKAAGTTADSAVFPLFPEQVSRVEESILQREGANRRKEEAAAAAAAGDTEGDKAAEGSSSSSSSSRGRRSSVSNALKEPLLLLTLDAQPEATVSTTSTSSSGEPTRVRLPIDDKGPTSPPLYYSFTSSTPTILPDHSTYYVYSLWDICQLLRSGTKSLFQPPLGLLSFSSTDAAIYLSFLKISSNLFSVLSFFGLIFLLPLNLLTPGKDSIHHTFFFRASAANFVLSLQNGTVPVIGVWVLYVMCWIFTSFCYYFVLSYWNLTVEIIQTKHKQNSNNTSTTTSSTSNNTTSSIPYTTLAAADTGIQPTIVGDIENHNNESSLPLLDQSTPPPLSAPKTDAAILGEQNISLAKRPPSPSIIHTPELYTILVSGLPDSMPDSMSHSDSIDGGAGNQGNEVLSEKIDMAGTLRHYFEKALGGTEDVVCARVIPDYSKRMKAEKKLLQVKKFLAQATRIRNKHKHQALPQTVMNSDIQEKGYQKTQIRSSQNFNVKSPGLTKNEMNVEEHYQEGNKNVTDSVPTSFSTISSLPPTIPSPSVPLSHSVRQLDESDMEDDEEDGAAEHSSSSSSVFSRFRSGIFGGQGDALGSSAEQPGHNPDLEQQQVTFWRDQYRRHSVETAQLIEQYPHRTTGMAFITFRNKAAAEQLVADPKIMSSLFGRSTAVQCKLAPSPRDIKWENIHLTGSFRGFLIVVLNILLVFVSMLVIAPATVLDELTPLIDNLEKAFNEDSYIRLTITDYLPPFILILINSNLLPYLVRYVSQKSRYWLKSHQATYILHGNIIYLILNTIFIPLMSLQSIEAVIQRMYHTDVGNWNLSLGSLLFSSSGSFALRYLQNCCLLTSASQLLQPGQLSLKGLLQALSSSPPNNSNPTGNSARSSICGGSNNKATADLDGIAIDGNATTVGSLATVNSKIINPTTSQPTKLNSNTTNDSNTNRNHSIGESNATDEDTAAQRRPSSTNFRDGNNRRSKDIVFEFDFGYWYALSLSLFTLVLLFSVVVPLLLPLGALFFCLKYLIDRYNFANSIFHISMESNGKVARIACKYMLFSIAFFQFCMSGFFLLQNNEPLMLAGMLLFVISTVSMILVVSHTMEHMTSFTTDSSPASQPGHQMKGFLTEAVEELTELEVSILKEAYKHPCEKH